MTKQSKQEFNPVKTKLEGMSVRELLHQFGSYYASSKESFYDSIDPFLEQFNPVKTEVEQPQPEIKTTAAFDNSRLEFLRMTIGPVQNFYQTLGNILYSFTMRLDVAEAKIESLKVQLDASILERRLYHKYLEECSKNSLVCSVDGFIKFISEYSEEKPDATKTDKD